MEKLNFISAWIDKWTNLTDKKKLSYLTGLYFVIAIVIIYIITIYFTNRITKIENEKIQQRNDYIIDLNRLNDRLSLEQEKTRECNDHFIKYLEKNEKEVRTILFNNERIKEKYKVKK